MALNRARTFLFSILLGILVALISLAGGEIFGLESEHAGYVLAESVFEGIVVTSLFYLWRSQLTLRMYEAETHARTLQFRNQLIRDHLQLIAFRCELDPGIQHNVREISRLLDVTHPPFGPNNTAPSPC
jgi:hypothetical protein